MKLARIAALFLILGVANGGLLFFYHKAKQDFGKTSSTPKFHFSNNSTLQPISQPVKTRLILGGDVMLGRSVMIVSEDSKNFFYPFEKISSYLNTGDIVFVNLESPIVSDCPRISDGYKFCTTPEIAEGLVGANITIVNLANNHIHNYGKEGFNQTKQILDKLHISFVGNGNVVTKTVNGTKFGFVGFDFLSNKPVEADFELINVAAGSNDVLVVGVHWGEEYTSEPNDFQIATAHKMIEAGANVIVGHHPHWVQEMEDVNGKKVYYSLGNLVFDQMWSEETKKGMLVELTFDANHLTSEKKISIYMENIGQPTIVDKQ